jgi:hypothetical protein
MTWQNSVSMSIGRAVCPDVNTLVSNDSGAGNISAIDAFYAATHPTLTKIDPGFIALYGNDIAGLLFVGLISATENYFRDALGFILTVCPVAQAHSADEKVQLGSLLWAENHLQNRSAFEFMAFSNAENIQKAIKNFACIQIKSGGTFDVMLKEYDKLCELRHAVVHSGHIVAGKNAIKLGLAKTKKPLRVSLNYASLQASGSVCTGLVQAANNELFEAIISRWATAWRKQSAWDPKKENALFRKIRNGFLSQRDYDNKSISQSYTESSLRAAVKTAFNLL